MYIIKQLPEDFIVKEIADLKIDPSGRYCYYLLKKRDYSTVKAVEIVAEKLGINRKFVNFAGNKDRVAVTEQYISVQDGPKANFTIGDIELKYVGRGQERINLGDLAGNHFEITVRNLNDKEIKSIKKETARIPNYFDDQRFGKNKDNHVVGKHIIKRQFKLACEHIPETDEWLKKKPNDYIGALRSIDKSILRMYIHSYQSYLWNKIAGTMIKGKKNIKIPIIGFETEIIDPQLAKAYENLLREEKITRREFILKEMPELTSEGGERDLFIEVKNFKIGTPEQDELNYGYKKMLLSFDLPKGCYATVVVKVLFNKTY
jgi:tRNA pseudouridine13 synthase